MQVAKEVHQPQEDAEVQSTQVENELHLSAGGDGAGGGGTAPLEKAVQLKTDNTASVVQGEFETPQLTLIALMRAPAVIYSKTVDVPTVLMMTLHPKDNVAVTGVVVLKDMVTA